MPAETKLTAAEHGWLDRMQQNIKRRDAKLQAQRQGTSKYIPHQGRAEMQRRVRQRRQG